MSSQAIAVALGAKIANPLVGLAITLVILKITWNSWRVVSTADPGDMIDDPLEEGPHVTVFRSNRT